MGLRRRNGLGLPTPTALLSLALDFLNAGSFVMFEEGTAILGLLPCDDTISQMGVGAGTAETFDAEGFQDTEAESWMPEAWTLKE